MERKKKKKMKIKKRKKERKEGFQIKDQKEVKREKKQFSINERKRTKILQSQIATQNHSWLAISHPTWTKRKRPKHPASSPKTLPSRKSYWSVIVRLIFDSIGNRVQNKVMVQLWFGNRIKHLPCEFYTLWVIYFQLSPMFPLHVHLKAKSWHPALHSRLQGRLPLAQVYCFSKIWCSREWFIFLCKKHVCLSGGKTRWTVRSRLTLFQSHMNVIA